MDEDPILLVYLLESADVRTGISQGELQNILEIRQARLSKLSAKLRGEGWIEDVPSRGEDGRIRRIRTSRKARNALRALEAALVSVMPKPRRRRRPSWRAMYPGAKSLLD